MDKNRLIFLLHKIACKYITSSYITDFLIHDIKTIYEKGIESGFIWQVRDTGTWLHRFCGENWQERALTYICHYSENFPQHFFLFDGKKIRRITKEKAIEIVEKSKKDSEEVLQKFDVYSCIEAEMEDGYSEIKKRLEPAENIDYEKLIKDEFFLWQTNKGELSISYECGNLISIKVRDDNGNYGYSATYDMDDYGLVCCVMSALRDYLKYIDETFVNEP